MACTFKAILNKDNRHNKSGLHSIFIRVTLARQSKYFNLDQKVELKHWLGKPDTWIKQSHPLAYELNALISARISDLKRFELRQQLFGNGISLHSLETYFKKKADRNLFNDYVADFVKNIRGKELNTLKLYRTFVTHLNEFRSSISFNQLNEKLFHDFAIWLRDEKGHAGITVHKYFKPFKLACKQAVKDGILDKDPFYGVSISAVVKAEKSKDRVYLEINEISQIKNCELPNEREDLIDVRKHFLFCFYAGFYYSDLQQLRWQDVKAGEHGYCIVGKRYKNDRGYVSPIYKFKHAVEIVESQKGLDTVLVFPNAISEQKYNGKLKDLATAAKLKKHLMNKTARHSFVQFWKAQGLATQHVQKMVGHSRESTTQHYFELSERDIDEQLTKFNFSKLDI